VQRSPCRPAPAQRRAKGESHDGEKARHYRDFANTGQSEAEENHVSCHVRHEHMPQPQVTEGVHKASYHRQANQEQRQRAVLAVSGPLASPHKNQANADTVMSRPNAALVKEFYPDVEVHGDLGEHDTLLSIDKARRLLGYQPAYSWRDTGKS
jgi:hypothetical protein